jgi:hypothetical protein
MRRPLLLAAALALSACGKSSADKPGAMSSAAPPAATAAPPDDITSPPKPTPVPSSKATSAARSRAGAPVDLGGKAFSGYTIDAPGASVSGGVQSAKVKAASYELSIYPAKPQDTPASVKTLFLKDRALKRMVLEQDDGFAAEFRAKFFGIRWVSAGDKAIYIEITAQSEQGLLEGFEAAGTVRKKG